jgi:pyruvate kinase
LQSSVGNANQSTRVTAAITGAAWRAAMEENAVAIIACTRSGMTARAISRFRPPMPIVAITPSASTARQLRGSWGIDKVVISPSQDIDELCEVAIAEVKKAGIAQSGDPIVIMAGSTSGGAQVTDTVRMLIVP